MTAESTSTPSFRLSRPLSVELKQLKGMTYGLCARENIVQDVCSASPINFAGDLLYMLQAQEFIAEYEKAGFVPHPDLYQPITIAENVTVYWNSIQSGDYVTDGLVARRVLIKRICGTHLGLVLGSGNNPDPLAGLLMRFHINFPNYGAMRAVRLLNDEQVSERELPYMFKNTDRMERAGKVARTFDLINTEQRMGEKVKQLYLQICAEIDTRPSMVSDVLNYLFATMGIDADTHYFHMTLWD